IGDMVKIKVDFDAGLDLTGTVEYISSEGEFTPKNLESKENRQEVVYETRIRIDNPDGRLKPGMLVDIYLGDDLNDQ
ncbi:efflux RND transporter periplasmic adaptor subunit, partial [Aduncisulcus paluster]